VKQPKAISSCSSPELGKTKHSTFGCRCGTHLTDYCKKRFP
jgi:hypothetical protein